MNEAFDPLIRLLSDVILPNLKSVQVSMGEQIAANDRLENEIDELRLHLNSQFAHLAAQLTACRAEIAATQEVLKAAQMQAGLRGPSSGTLIH
jgi:hypothetical protein